MKKDGIGHINRTNGNHGVPKFVRSGEWKGYPNNHWLKHDKDKVTILYNFIERRKSFFLQASFERAGYHYVDLGDYVYEDVSFGKEYGNRMECNPMYFTCGSLIRNLLKIHEETGMPKEEIVEKYVFVGGGGQCGPCRYGMYPQEYWKALNDAGFKDFRIIIFSSGFSNEEFPRNSAFTFDMPTKLNMVAAFVLADLMHIAECAVRPYAKDKEQALEVLTECENILKEAFLDKRHFRKLPGALEVAGRKLAAIPKTGADLPQIYVTGEIFANLAHNQGNYNLRRFIMDNGCEVMPGLFSQRVLYDYWRQTTMWKRTIRFPSSLKERFWLRFNIVQSTIRRKTVLFFWNRMVKPFNQESFGGKGKFMDLDLMAETGRDYYHPEIFGGEGNLEIAEAIYYADTMDGFISSKPFGCMPSSGVSDGVMAKVINRYPQLNFLSIETSGDNEVSILSRVSMLLMKAKQNYINRAG